MQVAQEDTKHAAAVPHARRAEIASAFRDESAEDRRRDRCDFATADTLKVSLERAKVVPIVVDARLAKPALLCEIVEEPCRASIERQARPSRATSTTEIQNGESQHLLHRIPCLACDLLPCHRRGASRAVVFRPPLHEGIDVGWKLIEAFRSPLAREIPKLDQDWHTAEHVAGCIAVVGQRRDVLLDGFADP